MAEAMSIKVSSKELKKTAGSIRTHNDHLNGYLVDIKDRIIRLQWKSDASDVIVKKIEKMQNHFDEYKRVIESYAKFLDDAADQYETTEETATANASYFRE